MNKIIPVFLLLIVFVIILAVTKESPVQPYSPVQAERRVILAFGDSLTYGTGAEHHQSYPALLQRMSGVKVINAGIPGEISAKGLKRLDSALEQYKPNLLILCHGGNDILRSLPEDALKANLSEMVHLAKSKNIAVLLVGMPNIRTLGFTTLDLYEEVAEEQHVMYEDTIIGKIERDASLKSDRIHPNTEGYRRMAEAFYNVLKNAGQL